MRKFVFPLSCLVVLFLGVVDHLTGYEISFSIFYFLPILLVSWFKVRPYAVLVSLLSAVVWMVADLTSGHYYSNFIIPLWNMTMRLVVFLFAVFLIYAFKKELELEKKLSRIDALTGLANIRYFIEQANTEISRSLRFNRPISIAYMDIDNFKKVNDSFGHDKGDDLLCLVGKTLKETIRTYDIAGRPGGDEFVILFPETNSQQAQTAINRVQRGFDDAVKKNIDFLSLSIGLVTYNKSMQSIREMIKTADNLMYLAKNSGKNAVNHKVIDS